MLSYRHSFHAGNFADVIKHIVLVEILAYLGQKQKPFEYIDTHAGAGLFDLSASDAKKLLEHQSGIGKLVGSDHPKLAPYLKVVQAHNHAGILDIYPGSPAIAAHFLRPQDRAWLYELHPQDYKLLCQNLQVKNTGRAGKVRAFCQNGLTSLHALLPPSSRRAIILIDPSYEIKSDYNAVFSTIADAYKKFPTGIFALWYPVVERHTINSLRKKFFHSGIKNIQRFELGIAADTQERGMTASGMFVINPPWTLFDTMSDLLPMLANTLKHKDFTGSEEDLFKCERLTLE